LPCPILESSGRDEQLQEILGVGAISVGAQAA
jgi:hypothetical protein